MTCTIDSKSKRRLPAKLAAGLAISAFLVLGTLVASASAAERRDDHRREAYHGGGYGGAYYAPPPVVYATPYYGTPYYAPPPVVYGPAIGVNLPGVSIGIF